MQIQELFTRLQPDLEDFVRQNGTQPVCEFVGAARSTVERWSVNSHPAQGQYAIRLWHFLLAGGYKPVDQKIPEYNFYVSQLYAYSVVEMEEVMQMVGVKNTQTALQIMRGQPPMHPGLSLEELKELYDESLMRKIEQLRKRLPVNHMTSDVVLPELPVPTEKVEALSPALDATVTALAHQLMAVLSLTELALDLWTPEQRSRLRELVGNNQMFRLANEFNALCSERARANQGRS